MGEGRGAQVSADGDQISGIALALLHQAALPALVGTSKPLASTMGSSSYNSDVTTV